MTRARHSDPYIISAPEFAMLWGVGTPAVLAKYREDEDFREQVEAPKPGKFAAFYLTKACRYICKGDEILTAEMVARWLPLIEAHRSGGAVAS